MTRTITPPEVRFWAKVEWGGPDECWPWTAGRSHGYGVFWVGPGELAPAHRYAYELLVGEPIPDELVGDHTCHNNTDCPGGDGCLHRRCCNPLHLEPKTDAENVAASHLSWGRKTHCPHGHEYTEDNTYRPPKTGQRMCRACKRQRDRERKKVSA